MMESNKYIKIFIFFCILFGFSMGYYFFVNSPSRLNKLRKEIGMQELTGHSKDRKREDTGIPKSYRLVSPISNQNLFFGRKSIIKKINLFGFDRLYRESDLYEISFFDSVKEKEVIVNLGATCYWKQKLFRPYIDEIVFWDDIMVVWGFDTLPTGVEFRESDRFYREEFEKKVNDLPNISDEIRARYRKSIDSGNLRKWIDIPSPPTTAGAGVHVPVAQLKN